MPTPLIVGSSRVRIRVYSSQASQLAINTIYALPSAVAGAPQTSDFAAQYSPVVGGLLKALLANTATFRGITVQDITLTPKIIPDVSTVGTGIGTAGATPLPAQTCGLVTLQTIFAGRAGRGRWYVPFPATSAQTAPNETPNAGYVTSLIALGTALSGTFNMTGAFAGTVMLMEIKASKTLTFTTVNTVIARAKWATQKRRGDYGRTNVFPF